MGGKSFLNKFGRILSCPRWKAWWQVSEPRKERHSVPCNSENMHDNPGNFLRFSIGPNGNPACSCQTLFFVLRNVLCSWHSGEQVSPLEPLLSVWNRDFWFFWWQFLRNNAMVLSNGVEELGTKYTAIPVVVRGCCIFSYKRFQTDLFLTSQLQLMPHLWKLKIPASTANYMPVDTTVTLDAY